jgi:CDP-diglyceride synthetase
MHHPLDASFKEYIIQEIHHPRDASSKVNIQGHIGQGRITIVHIFLICFNLKEKKVGQVMQIGSSTLLSIVLPSSAFTFSYMKRQ